MDSELCGRAQDIKWAKKRDDRRPQPTGPAGNVWKRGLSDSEMCLEAKDGNKGAPRKGNENIGLPKKSSIDCSTTTTTTTTTTKGKKQTNAKSNASGGFPLILVAGRATYTTNSNYNKKKCTASTQTNYPVDCNVVSGMDVSEPCKMKFDASTKGLPSYAEVARNQCGGNTVNPIDVSDGSNVIPSVGSVQPSSLGFKSIDDCGDGIQDRRDLITKISERLLDESQSQTYDQQLHYLVKSLFNCSEENDILLLQASNLNAVSFIQVQNSMAQLVVSNRTVMDCLTCKEAVKLLVLLVSDEICCQSAMQSTNVSPDAESPPKLVAQNDVKIEDVCEPITAFKDEGRTMSKGTNDTDDEKQNVRRAREQTFLCVNRNEAGDPMHYIYTGVNLKPSEIGAQVEVIGSVDEVTQCLKHHWSSVQNRGHKQRYAPKAPQHKPNAYHANAKANFQGQQQPNYSGSQQFPQASSYIKSKKNKESQTAATYLPSINIITCWQFIVNVIRGKEPLPRPEEMHNTFGCEDIVYGLNFAELYKDFCDRLIMGRQLYNSLRTIHHVSQQEFNVFYNWYGRRNWGDFNYR